MHEQAFHILKDTIIPTYENKRDSRYNQGHF
jgi:hypothetical protein